MIVRCNKSKFQICSSQFNNKIICNYTQRQQKDPHLNSTRSDTKMHYYRISQIPTDTTQFKTAVCIKSSTMSLAVHYHTGILNQNASTINQII